MAKLVSKVYGDALFAAAKDLAVIDQAYEEVTALRDIFAENMDLRKILNSPKISREEKAQIIHTIFEHQVSDMLMGFLITVVNKGRQAEFERIFSYFISIVKEYKGIGVASVVSAMPLTKLQEEEIEKKLLATTEYNQMEMNYSVDESLIGGMTIRIKDRVIDSSIKTKLYNIKKNLLNVQI